MSKIDEILIEFRKICTNSVHEMYKNQKDYADDVIKAHKETKQALYKDIDDRILALQQNGLVSQEELRTKLKEYYGVEE